MPSATIEVRRSYTPAEEEGIIDAVHAAMVEGLQIPAWDKTIRLVVHEAHRFPAPPGKSERYTLVDVDLIAGRSLKVLLRESPLENWGIRGVPASDLDLGYKIDV